MTNQVATFVKTIAWFVLGLSALLLSGCTSKPVDQFVRVIVSEPTGIYISIKNSRGVEEFNCVTPCKLKVDRPRKIVASKEGYVSQIFYVEPGTGVINVILQLAAASEAVDTAPLPEID